MTDKEFKITIPKKWGKLSRGHVKYIKRRVFHGPGRDIAFSLFVWKRKTYFYYFKEKTFVVGDVGDEALSRHRS